MSIEAILESIEKLTLLEAAELVKAMEEKFGVSAAAPVAVAAAPAAAAAPAEHFFHFRYENKLLPLYHPNFFHCQIKFQVMKSCISFFQKGNRNFSNYLRTR